MNDWGDGYVTDVEYMPGCYREQAPLHMALACLLGGVAPADLPDDYVYCDFGCGAGQTVALLAAANPKARFYGVDFHPAHIARAQAFARRAGLTNLTYVEAGFADLADGNDGVLPPLDVAALHGVYAWISAENRAALARLLARRVKPGGMVYVSYNAQPGWTPTAPLQRLMLEYATLTHGPATTKAAAALDFALLLREAGASTLGDAETLVKLKAAGPTENPADKLAYLAHEYLNAHWTPLYHADVVRELAASKLTYAGSATLLENFPALSLTERQQEALATIPDPTLRETFKDYCVNRPFRRDVFVRGARRLTDAERDGRLAELRLALILPREDCRAVVNAPLGEAQLDERRYAAIFDALADGPKTAGELAALPAVRAGAGRAPGPGEIAGILTGSRQTMVAGDEDPTADEIAAARRVNQVKVREALTDMSRKTTALAAPLCRAGLHLSLVEALLYDAAAAGVEDAPAIVDHALRRLTGEAVAPADHPNRAALTDSLAWCRENSLPMWRRLGMI